MPAYDFYCKICDIKTESFERIADRKQFISCEKCGGSAERIISSQILRVEPTWLDSAKRQLHGQDKGKITDRNTLNRYLKKEGIEPVG